MLLRQRGDFLYFAQRHLLASGAPVPPSRDWAWLERGFVYASWTAGSGSLIVMRLALPPATWPAQDNSQERKHESESETSKAGQRLGSGRRVLAPALSSGSRLLQALPAHHTLARCHHLHRMPAKQWVGPRSPCVHWVCRNACRSGGAGLSTAPGTASQASPPALPGSGRPDVSLTCSFRKNRVSPVQQSASH